LTKENYFAKIYFVINKTNMSNPNLPPPSSFDSPDRQAGVSAGDQGTGFIGRGLDKVRGFADVVKSPDVQEQLARVAQPMGKAVLRGALEATGIGTVVEDGTSSGVRINKVRAVASALRPRRTAMRAAKGAAREFRREGLRQASVVAGELRSMAPPLESGLPTAFTARAEEQAPPSSFSSGSTYEAPPPSSIVYESRDSQPPPVSWR
jgi:hypothetical protein